MLSFWHFSWAADTSFLDSSQDQLCLFVTLVFFKGWNPSKELNDISSDSWTEHQFIARETFLLRWNTIIISSLEKVSVHLCFLFPSVCPKPESSPLIVWSEKTPFPSHLKWLDLWVLWLENLDFYLVIDNVCRIHYLPDTEHLTWATSVQSFQ